MARDGAWRELLACLRSVGDDVSRAVEACFELDRVADATWIPRLRRLLRHGGDSFVREAAARPLARLEGTRCLRRLLAARELGTAGGHDNDGLSSTIVGVVLSDPDGALPILRRLIASRRASERADGAWLWGFSSGSTKAEPLLRLTRDRSLRVRAAAVGSLASFAGQDGVLEAVLASVADRSPDVRIAAALALRSFDARDARAALSVLARDPAPRVAEYVALCAERHAAGS